ncbi:hypothetical protein M378DRAFT_16276 [Amanita muscaria Koide BX008]|uniref:Uncharacterized protein n=1 Tax=Amanita muscaria (strain Koide BX008) TaxID=946122 RepID=A0A0C2STN9_AMAMK|nr:hypothetical protein M378DRAFT_16276 [Amanita muscaria Koide BX008]
MSDNQLVDQSKPVHSFLGQKTGLDWTFEHYSSPAIEFKNIVVNEVLSAAYHKLASVLPPPPSMSPSPSSCSPPPPPPVTDPSSLYSLIHLVLPQTFHM